MNWKTHHNAREMLREVELPHRKMELFMVACLRFSLPGNTVLQEATECALWLCDVRQRLRNLDSVRIAVRARMHFLEMLARHSEVPTERQYATALMRFFDGATADDLLAMGLKGLRPSDAAYLLREVYNPERVCKLCRGTGNIDAPGNCPTCHGSGIAAHTVSPDADHIASIIYNDQDWRMLPVLADALEDCGCSDEELLLHFRSNCYHVRGCWALDEVKFLARPQ